MRNNQFDYPRDRQRGFEGHHNSWNRTSRQHRMDRDDNRH